MSGYTGASQHYLSPSRRDQVKRFWEEPVNHAVLRRAVQSLARQADAPLRVLDVGAGTGDGLALLEAAVPRPISYLGLDLDPEMVQTAKSLHHDRETVEFAQGDIRTDLPSAPFDIYLSAGVPYSHLTSGELLAAVTGILRAAKRNRTVSSVVIDVLGRYSPEWEPHWGSDRWDYNTSFFHDTDLIVAPMTFYTRPVLRELVRTACAEAGVSVRHLDFADRAVLVGRHTSTAAFNPGIRPLRTLVNRLYDGDRTVDLAGLVVTPPATAAPDVVHAFFATLTTVWNQHIADTADLESAIGGPTQDTRRALAASLCRTEHGLTRGLGVGHTLIATVTVEP